MAVYRSIEVALGCDRCQFMWVCTATAGGAVLGVAPVWGEKAWRKPADGAPAEVVTNIDDFMKVPRASHAIPGPYPGRVVEVHHPGCLVDDAVDGAVVRDMVTTGISRLTGVGARETFAKMFAPDDVVGLKVNPVGPPLVNTRHEVVEAVIAWLVDGGLARKNIVIWDRFDTMLNDAGYTAERYPGVRVEALQTMDEEGSSWRGANGRHVSDGNFDREAFYLAKGIEGRGVRGYESDELYLNQHDARHTASRYQVQLVKGVVYATVNDLAGDGKIGDRLVELARNLADFLPAADAAPVFEALPAEGRVQGSERVIRGPFTLEAVYTLGEGDILSLGGELTAVSAEYQDAGDDRFAVIVVGYPEVTRASEAFDVLAAGLDPYLEIQSRGTGRVVFKDYAGQYGEVVRKGPVLWVRVNLSEPPPGPEVRMSP